MSTESFGEGRRRLLIPAAAAALVVLVVVVVLLVTRDKTGTLNVSSIPGDLTLTLDEQQIEANGATKIPAGTHTLVARRTGFGDETRTVEIKGGKTVSLGLVLLATGPEGRAYYKDHPEEGREAEAEAGRRFAEQGAERDKRYPILQQLPHIGAGFKVDYGHSQADPKDPLKVALYIRVWGADGREQARIWLKENNVDPDTQEIIWSK